MTRYEDCIQLISAVAEALGPYRSEFVFVGGAVAGLLMTAGHLQDVRPTDDVDLVVETATYSKYTELLARLRKLGFKHDMHGPLCRFTVGGITVDVMPTEEKILGFRNKWYQQVVKSARNHPLANGVEIRLITAPMFVCTKLEAFRDRGKGDFFASADIEDIVAVINGRQELVDECREESAAVREYLKGAFAELQDDDDFFNALPGLLPHGSENRVEVVISRMEELARLPVD